MHAQSNPTARAQVEAQRGWEAVRDGRNQDAAEAFALALDAEPSDPSPHFGAGVAAYLLGRPTVAQHSLERALELAPGLTDASMLLATVLYRASDIAGAIRVYEAALEYAPEDGTLRTRLDDLHQEAAVHGSFLESQGAHFTILFEGAADPELTSRVSNILEAAYWRVSTALAVYPERPITVVLYTQEQFRDITQSPQWAAAAYDGRIRLPVGGADTDPDELERVIVHEFTHALVQTLTPRGVPMWLHEGLAVMFEPNGEAWIDEQLSRTPSRLPFERLAGSFGDLSGDDARLAYAQSAGIVRALFESGGPLTVGSILQDIARGDTFVIAFEQRMFMSYDAFLAGLASGR
ncbi:MAG: tetratricopeptide repeat protein [Acidobacteria bacterium]|nr:tetratricopeptide repeat protein [Acidobacteriota bacterium]